MIYRHRRRRPRRLQRTRDENAWCMVRSPRYCLHVRTSERRRCTEPKRVSRPLRRYADKRILKPRRSQRLVTLQRVERPRPLLVVTPPCDVVENLRRDDAENRRASTHGRMPAQRRRRPHGIEISTHSSRSQQWAQPGTDSLLAWIRTATSGLENTRSANVRPARSRVLSGKPGSSSRA